jgi:hypothetical protein
VVVCVLLVAGLIASLRVDPPKPLPPLPDDPTPLVVIPPPNAAAPVPQTSPIPSIEKVPSVGDPVVVSESSPFNKIKPQSNRTVLKTPPTAGSPVGK